MVEAKRQVLVTGAHGFIGRHVARRLATAGHTVTGLGHGGWSMAEAAAFGVTFWHTADITLDALVTYAGKPALIVHCAGSGSVPFSISQPHQDFQRTVSNTAAVLEYVRLHSPGTAVVYPSSAAVYGAATRMPIEESAPMQPASPYGVHKLMAEELCQSYARHCGVPVAVVRFFSIYGAGLRKQLLWDACTKALDAETSFHGTGAEIRDWLHVDDAAALLVATAAHASTDCPIVNGGSGHGTTIASVLDRVFSALAIEARPTFNGVGRSGDPSRYVADIRKALAYDWTPRVSLDDGVRAYVDWFRSVR